MHCIFALHDSFSGFHKKKSTFTFPMSVNICTTSFKNIACSRSRAGTIRLNSKAQRAARFMMILIAGHHPADKLSVRLPDYKVIDLVFPPMVLSKGFRQPNKPIPALKNASLLIVNSSTIKIACQFCEIKYYCEWICIGC